MKVDKILEWARRNKVHRNTLHVKSKVIDYGDLILFLNSFVNEEGEIWSKASYAVETIREYVRIKKPHNGMISSRKIIDWIQSGNSLVSEDEEECPICGDGMTEEKVTYTDGIGNCRGFTCYGCGYSMSMPLKETDEQIALRMIEEYLKKKPSTSGYIDSLAGCIEWLDKEE